MIGERKIKLNEREIERRSCEIKGRIEEPQYGQHLYHYTSLKSLHGILTNQELWLGSTASMNDKSEIHDFIWRMRDALLQDLPAEKHSTCKELFEKIDARLDSEYPFAICFSDLEDSAAQWERYADNARGVCIVFNTQSLMELAYYTGALFFNKVFYEYDIRKHDHYKSLYCGLTDGNWSGFQSETGRIDNILACAYIHKHKSFNTESETRVTTLWGDRPSCSDVSFEPINGQIKRVLKLDLKKMCEEQHVKFERLIDQIVIGPHSKQSVYELREFVKHCNFPYLANKISTSQCPL